MFSGAPAAASEGWEGIVPWAASRNYAFRDVPSEGFVVDGRLEATPWRLEWGPSQRPYIEGHELRLRAEMGLQSDLQLVVMNRELQETLEQAVFNQYVEGVQTRIDNQTPPEMRWLVMFPKLSGSEMGPLHERFIALSSIKGWLVRWLEGPLAQSLGALRVEASMPMVLMIGRGRLMLRTTLAEPELPAVQAWLRLFETAMREARRVSARGPESSATSTQPGAWTGSALPGDERNT
jgi:hypothetical protein